MPTPARTCGVPIFIVSHARTGSTLLRYIIDTHPALCCPSEIALGQLCKALSYTLTLTEPHHVARAPEAGAPPMDYEMVRLHAAMHAHVAVRRHVDEIMEAYCTVKNKRRWCDKSSNNVRHLKLLARIFPDAQYLCLHRHALDVAHSLINLFRLNFPGRYGELVTAARGNIVDAMIDGWTEATADLLEFEAANPTRCFHMKYEDLIADPVSVTAAMFAFLNEPFEPGMLDRVFSAPHDPGPGDQKIQYTSRILQNRIGRGQCIPVNQISDDRLRSLNALHERLGYAPLSRDEPSAAAGVTFEAAKIGGASMPVIPEGHWEETRSLGGLSK